MFNFFKDVYYEVNGIEKQEKKKEKKIFFSRLSKVVILLVGLLYLAISVAGIKDCLNSNSYGLLLKFAFLSILDVAALVFMFIRTKRTEMIALGFMVLFVIINYASILI